MHFVSMPNTYVHTDTRSIGSSLATHTFSLHRRNSDINKKKKYSIRATISNCFCSVIKIEQCSMKLTFNAVEKNKRNLCQYPRYKKRNKNQQLQLFLISFFYFWLLVRFPLKPSPCFNSIQYSHILILTP